MTDCPGLLRFFESFFVTVRESLLYIIIGALYDDIRDKIGNFYV